MKYARFLLIALFLWFGASISLGQNSPAAKKTYEKAMKLYEKGKYSEVAPLIIEAVAQERSLEEEADYIFIGDLWFLYGRFFISRDFYQAASQFFFVSAISYQVGNDSVKARDALQQAAYFADSSLKYQSKGFFKADSVSYPYIRYPISDILKVNGDTTWFTTNLGTSDSIRDDHTAEVITIYDKRDTARKLEYFGSAKLVSKTNGRSTWYVVMDDDFKDNFGYPLQPKDMVYTRVVTDETTYKGLIYELAKMGVLFKDYNSKLMYNYKLVQMMTMERSENALIRMMRNQIRRTAQSLYDSTTTSNIEPLDSGAFAGLNMWEAMLQTEDIDVRAFLRFVRDFPGKYIGRDFRIDETYATWLINFTPPSNQEAKLILDQYDSANTEAEYQKWKKTYARYITSAEFDFSKIRNRLYKLSSDKQYHQADSIAQQWVQLCDDMGFDNEKFEFNTTRANILSTAERYDEALKIFEKQLELRPDDLSTHYLMGHTYLSQENYILALKKYKLLMDSAAWFAGGHGMYGWTLLKMGRFNASEEPLYKAYTLDSTNPIYIMNYGHILLLKDNPKEARQLYNKVLDHIVDQSAFTEGIIEDFDFFEENGWAVEQVKLERNYLNNEWNKHYKFKVAADEYAEKGKELKDDEDYIAAAKEYAKAIEEENQGRYIRYNNLRMLNRWYGYCNYKAKVFPESLKGYTEGWNISRDFIKDAEMEASDLENISNIHDWLDNDIQQKMYMKMHYAAQRKLQDQKRSNRLFMVSIGSNSSRSDAYKYAEADAKKIAEMVEEKSKLIFDQSYVTVLSQHVINRDTLVKVIENVIGKSRAGDCFVLYFSGYTEDNAILLDSGSITNKQLMGWLSSMGATKKLILMDAENGTLVSDFIESEADNRNEYSSSSTMMLISDGRVEIPHNNTGLFTSYLINGLKGKAATHWHIEKQESNLNVAKVTSKSLEGYMYGNLTSGNMQFDLKSYSSGVDFPLTFVNTLAGGQDTVPPMIYLPNVITSDGKRGGKTKIVTVKEQIEGQALDASGISSVKVNGHALEFTQNGKFTIAYNFTNAWSKLTVEAIDKSGNRAVDSFFVKKDANAEATDELEERPQKNYALLFATNKYDDPGWANLENPKKDVKSIGAKLERNYGYEVRYVFDTTAAAMESILRSYLTKKYGPKDHLFVYFAGHGHLDPFKGGHIVGRESKSVDPNLKSYLSFRDITEYLNNAYGCKHIFLALDVCFGGSAFRGSDNIDYSPGDIQIIRKNPKKFADNKSKYRSRVYLTSGGEEYVPDESFFAKKVIETLESNGKSKNGLLSFEDFVESLNILSSLPESERPPTPRFGTFGDHDAYGDFILLYQEKDTPAEKELNKKMQVQN